MTSLSCLYRPPSLGLPQDICNIKSLLAEFAHRPEGAGELLFPLFWPFPFPTEPTPFLFPLLPAEFPLPLKFPFPAPTAPAPFPTPLVPPVLPCPFCTPFTGGAAFWEPPVPLALLPPFPGVPCGVFVSRPRAFPTLLSTRLYELTEPAVGNVTVSDLHPAVSVFCAEPCPESTQSKAQHTIKLSDVLFSSCCFKPCCKICLMFRDACPLVDLTCNCDLRCHAKPAVGHVTVSKAF